MVCQMNRTNATDIKLPLVFLACWLIVCASRLSAEDAMSWVSNFGPISLGPLTTQAEVKTASSTATLVTTGDCEISADQSSVAQLSGPGGDTLITEYKLECDGDGGTHTGGAMVDFTAYDTFLASPAMIRHVPSDDEVVVTLWVRAKNYPNYLANAGDYTATQTLTVHWTGP
jgi:hypothetical protein